MKKIVLTEKEFFYNDENVFTQTISNEYNSTHSHEFIEFFYILSGKCIHEFDGNKKTLSTGDARFILPADTHRFINSKSDFLHRDILFKIDFFKKICDTYSPDLFNQILNKNIKLNFVLSNEQINLLENICPYIKLKTDQNKVKMAETSVLTFVLNLVVDKIFNESNVYPQWIKTITAIFSSFETAGESLDSITSKFSYTKSYMCRTFKKYTGMTMTDYYNKHRMQHAYNLIKTTNKSTEEICELVGLNNISHFYALFKKEFGLTPNSLRQKITE